MGGTKPSSACPHLSSSLVSFCAALVAVVLVLISDGAVVCHGGKTSAFVRKVEKGTDMPLDSDVFRVPPGYNAPQQVLSAYFCFYIFTFLRILVPVKLLMGTSVESLYVHFLLMRKLISISPIDRIG